jgi:hypothetical protein
MPARDRGHEGDNMKPQRLEFSPNAAADSGEPAQHSLEKVILGAIRAIRYGSVEIVIHDSRVVQIERNEKLRWDRGSAEEARFL